MKNNVPIHGHYPLASGGALPASILTEGSHKDVGRTPTDWNVSGVELVSKILPRIEKDQGTVSHVIWNEGIWGRPDDWVPLMRTVREFLQKRQGRAFWKGTSQPGYRKRAE